VCRPQPPASSLSSKAMSYTSKLGPELLKGQEAFDSDGQIFLSASLELLFIKESLKSLKGKVDVGIERIDAVIKSLKNRGPRLGS
jgi:hypothetical protein